MKSLVLIDIKEKNIASLLTVCISMKRIRLQNVLVAINNSVATGYNQMYCLRESFDRGLHDFFLSVK